MANESYQINVNDNNELCLSGHIDFSNVKEASNVGTGLIKNLPNVTINLAGLKYADSSCLAMLIAWICCANKQHKNILFKDMPQFLLDLGRVCGLDAILPIDKPLEFQD